MTAMFCPPTTVRATISVRQVFGFDQHGDERFWARVRGTQVAMVIRHSPPAIVAMAINLTPLAWVLRNTVQPWFVAAWAAVMGTLAIVWTTRWLRSRMVAEPDVASLARFWGLSAEVASFGLIWGALMLHMLPLVSPEMEVIMVLLSLAAMGACGFATFMLPMCAAALVISIGVLTLAGLPSTSPLSTPMVWLAFTTFGALSIYGIVLTSSAMMTKQRTQAERDDASEVIGLLLGEFEAHGSDWLIEVDARGRLTRVSSRMCEVSGRPRELLVGAALTSLLGPDRRDPAVRGAIRTLERYFAKRTPFRDFVVPVAVDGALRWWSLTGTPRFDAGGGFTGYRGVGCDVTEVRQAADRIVELARFDPLTGLANRALIRSTIGDLLGGSNNCALLFLDLDHFKQVNDSLGHHVGDLLLREVAVRLRGVAGALPRIGRLGGDEFAVVVPSCTPRRAEQLAKAVVAALSEPFSIDGHTVAIGASVGYAIGPGDGACVDALLRAADLALYEVKGSGRGAACRFVPEIQARAEARRELEVDLARALDRGELSLAYQPIVEAADEHIVGFEALLRWTHPRLGEVSPAVFIPVAEDTGLIGRIGDWVIEEACRRAADWPSDIRISVNLSPVQFDDVNLPRTIRSALIASGIAADRLELEITESVFLNDRPATAAMIARLKALGIRFALDDFGTGYSSLSYLRKAEFSRIKIDRSFVQCAATDDGESTAIIKAIVSLAASLGMATTAEGTETRAEFEACRALGCGQIQGYFFGRPMPPEDATALVTLRLAA